MSDGYRIGAEKTEEVLIWCADLDIPTVTLWALSTDNLTRPVNDVADILEVIEAKMAEWIQGGLAQRLGMRIRPIGLLELLRRGISAIAGVGASAPTGFSSP